MRIVFMGTPDFAVPSLEALVARGDTVVGVFTQPDKPKGRGKKMAPPPVKVAAQAHGIPVYQPRRIRKDGVEDLRALAPDLCVTAAFGQILSQEILDIPRLGTINVHASLLPRHRGSAPIAWGILQGDSQAGITTMFTDKGIDTGDMLLSSAVDILPGETCGELTERLSRLGAQVLLDTLAALEAGALTRTPAKRGGHDLRPHAHQGNGHPGLVSARPGAGAAHSRPESLARRGHRFPGGGIEALARPGGA